MIEIQGEANSCLNESQIKYDCEENTSKNSDFCLRFLRKKYKCCLLWLLSIFSGTQLLYIILDKIDQSLLNRALGKLINMSNNSTICECP